MRFVLNMVFVSIVSEVSISYWIRDLLCFQDNVATDFFGSLRCTLENKIPDSDVS